MYKQLAGRLIGILTLTSLAKFAIAAVPPPAVPAVTLADCYQRALTVSETLAISDQEIEQIAAVYRQGVGNVLPHISWNMTQYWQDTSSVSSSTGPALRQRTPESYFKLTQPLFHGLRDFNAVKGFKSARRGAELNRKQAALNLLSDVAEVFYVSYDLQQELEALQSQRTLTEDRLKELERRVRLGRSRDSEVLSSQVELASLDAQIEDTRQRWSTARITLQFLTEVSPTTPLIGGGTAIPEAPPLESVKEKAMSRPDLLAAGYLKEQEHFNVNYAKGDYFPDLDFTGRYFTERVGSNKDSKWDAMLSLEVPLFTGLITRGEVQEARAREIVADLTIARLKRQIRREVEAAHDTLRYATSQARYYANAVELAEKNYKVQREEYRLGLINNLQVLQVLTNLQDLKIRQLRAEAAARVSDIKLRVASGQGLK